MRTGKKIVVTTSTEMLTNQESPQSRMAKYSKRLRAQTAHTLQESGSVLHVPWHNPTKNNNNKKVLCGI